jgi:hypothetical protein
VFGAGNPRPLHQLVRWLDEIELNCSGSEIIDFGLLIGRPELISRTLCNEGIHLASRSQMMSCRQLKKGGAMNKAFRAIALVAVAVSVLGGSANAGTRHLRIPPPPLPGVRNLPVLRVPVPGSERTNVRKRYVRSRRNRVSRSHTRRVWVRGHYVRVR